MSPSRVIIVAGGFGGVKCAKVLRKTLRRDLFEIVLFNHENHMVFHPATNLYVIKTGEVEVLAGDREEETILAILGPGDFLVKWH